MAIEKVWTTVFSCAVNGCLVHPSRSSAAVSGFRARNAVRPAANVLSLKIRAARGVIPRLCTLLRPAEVNAAATSALGSDTTECFSPFPDACKHVLRRSRCCGANRQWSHGEPV